jgi:single-stranded DNA-binding protein
LRGNPKESVKYKSNNNGCVWCDGIVIVVVSGNRHSRQYQTADNNTSKKLKKKVCRSLPSRFNQKKNNNNKKKKSKNKNKQYNKYIACRSLHHDNLGSRHHQPASDSRTYNNKL